jgi:putative tryptophan/tyrosine transport system substrate-binding protein
MEARSVDDFDIAFASARKERLEALVVLSAPIMNIHADRIADLALKNRLPSISNAGELPKAGGLMSYGPNINDLCRRAAIYVDKILKGANPADLPMEQPTRFELIINTGTAKALALNIPPALLAVADEVIE